MNENLSLSALEDAAALVHRTVTPTPQHCWPLLSARAGAEVWVKHENHTATGAFKLRGGLVYVDRLKRREPNISGVVAATRGNHGQSVAFAARRAGLKAVVVVPHGNSRDKNAAMRAFGVRSQRLVRKVGRAPLPVLASSSVSSSHRPSARETR